MTYSAFLQLLFKFYGGKSKKDCFVYDFIKHVLFDCENPFSLRENLRRFLNGQSELSIRACHFILANFNKNRFMEYLSSINDSSIHPMIKAFREMNIKLTKNNYKEVIVDIFECILNERIRYKDKETGFNCINCNKDLNLIQPSEDYSENIRALCADLLEKASGSDAKSFINELSQKTVFLRYVKSLDTNLEFKHYSIIDSEIHIFCEMPKLFGRRVRCIRIRKIKDIILNGLKVVLNLTSRRYDPVSDDSKYTSDTFSFVLPFKRKTERFLC